MRPTENYIMYVWRSRPASRSSRRTGVQEHGFHGKAGVKVAGPAATAESERHVVYTVGDILKILPHRYPFLLVDRIIALEPDKHITGLKNVTVNEPFFQGHFPGAPVMPGVLIIESMAQVAGVLIYRDLPEKEKKLIYFTGIENAKFRRPVTPGDQLLVEMDLLVRRNNYGKMAGRATVDGKLAAEATVLFAIVDYPAK
ncbi:MAG: 3-hydroxyacyl-ACP dehydratase FabZ [Terriglobia bacterium]